MPVHIRKKILIIEDDPCILEILEYIFNTDAFEPIASNRPLPVDSIVGISPDVILLDHWLGDRFGGDFCKEIKAYRATSKIPVIMLSAHIDLIKLANDSCADGFFEKPFDIDELYQYIKGFTDRQ